ncbi:DNA-binding transcription factor yap1 [Rhodotorula sphaerocarpa]
MSEASRSPELASSEQRPRKRGRKRIEEPIAQAAATADQVDAEKKRKLQNRAAQRAFRERKEKHVSDLEQRVKLQEDQLNEFVLVIRRPPKTLIPQAALTFQPPSDRLQVTAGSIDASSSPHEVKPRVKEQSVDSPTTVPPNAPAVAETSHQPPQHPPSLPRPPVPIEREPSSLDILATASQSPATVRIEGPSRVSEAVPLDEMHFDFDAPFDFSETMPLPPLFSSVAQDYEMLGSFSGSAPATPAAAGDAPNDGEGDDTCPNEEDEPPLLPGNRIPCDKPECDFTAVSCALPVPWRPPTVAGDDKNLWVAQKCWAKLCSHPLFPLCDSDELCQLLRDKTRCSDDGRLVCHKADVCDIFRSLPKRAKLRQQTLSMA